MNEYSFNRKRIYANFERKNKWLGIIDYKTLCFVLGYAGIIILILSKIGIKFEYKIYLFSFLSLPIFAMFICSDMKQDSVLDMFVEILNFIIKRSVYAKEKRSFLLKDVIIYKKVINKKSIL